MTMNAGGGRTTTADVYADLTASSLTFTPESTFLPMKHTPKRVLDVAVENRLHTS